MEDQQPVAGDLTGLGDDKARAESGVETEAAAQQSEPETPVEQKPQRRHSMLRRRRSYRAAAVQDTATAPHVSDDADTGHVEDGDTTAQKPVATPDEAAAESAENTAAPAAEPGPDDAAATTPAELDSPTVRAKKSPGKRLAAAVMVAAALFVGSAAFAGAMVQPYIADRAVVATKLNVARTAASAITTLWSYTPENLDKLGDRAAAFLSGDFEAQYRKFVDALVAPNKQAQVTNSTLVTGAAVESLDGPNAVAMVYTNTTSTSPLTKNIPALKYLSYRLFMKRDHARWLVTRMTTITSLDLTPQL